MTFYYKVRQILLQTATVISLQNATEVYYKIRQDFYLKMRQLLQNVTFVTKCDSTLMNIMRRKKFHLSSTSLLCIVNCQNVSTFKNLSLFLLLFF